MNTGTHASTIAHDCASPLERLRADFPVLRRTMRGKPLVYLDNGATSLKPQSVIDAETAYLSEIGANIHRGVYELSETATALYDAAREKVKRFIAAPAEGEAVFTKGATEAINIVAFGWARTHLGPGDEIVLTEIEHHANLVPWQEIARMTGARLVFVALGPRGEVTADAVRAALTDRTKLVAVTGMSNVTGHRPPVAEIARAAHEAGAVIVVDGAQLVSHHPVDVAALGIDFLAFSGHKMCGPTGVGVLYGRSDLLDATNPLVYGGDMIVKVQRETSTYLGAPEKFESGTPNIAGVIGLGAAVDYLSEVGMDRIVRRELELTSYARRALESIPAVTVYGPPPGDDAGGIVSFNVGDVHPHDVGTILDTEGVAVRAGFHCAQPFMRVLGVPGTVRASFYLYNGTDDVDRLVAAIHRVREVFG